MAPSEHDWEDRTDARAKAAQPNARAGDNFAGADFHPDPDDTFADAVQGALSEPIPTGAGKDRGIFERSIAARKREKAKQQQIIAAARIKCRQLTESIHAMEASLDLLLEMDA